MSQINLRSAKYNKFSVQSSYCDYLVAICKSIKGREWNPETKEWCIPKDNYLEFKNMILSSFIDGRPRYIIIEDLTLT